MLCVHDVVVRTGLLKLVVISCENGSMEMSTPLAPATRTTSRLPANQIKCLHAVMLVETRCHFPFPVLHEVLSQVNMPDSDAFALLIGEGRAWSVNALITTFHCSWAIFR